MNTATWRPPSSGPRAAGPAWANARPRRELRLATSPVRVAQSLEIRLLSELVRAHTDTYTVIDSALSVAGQRAPDLGALRGDLRRRLDQLLESLLEFCVERDAVDALVPLVFFVDEQVERALLNERDTGRYSWLPLQRDLFSEDRADGGDVFFERAEALLGEPSARPVVIVAYLFCLKANFRGRLCDEPEDSADRWMDRLAACLPTRQTERARRPSVWRAPRPAATYLSAAAALVLFWHGLIWVWAYWR
ncbi:MAG TPA: DotU family type IV/VI secretion system protein [Polyangiaceae bacterium]|nr:DotU family type IV/VI secretion system protein [Polyangiaceae bacterium]